MAAADHICRVFSPAFVVVSALVDHICRVFSPAFVVVLVAADHICRVVFPRLEGFGLCGAPNVGNSSRVWRVVEGLALQTRGDFPSFVVGLVGISPTCSTTAYSAKSRAAYPHVVFCSGKRPVLDTPKTQFRRFCAGNYSF